MSDRLQNIIRKYSAEGDVTVDVKTFLSAEPAPKKAFLYSFFSLNLLGETFVDGEAYRLPAQRGKKCAAYRNQSDKKACLLAYLFLEDGLFERYGITDEPSFVYNKDGKPYLRDTPHVFFNFSHSGNAVACVLADFEIGLDIQEIRQLNIDIARRVCSENELRQLEESEDARRLFHRFWTEKESYAKAHGVGVTGIFKHELPTDRLKSWDVGSYCMSICCERILREI